MAKQSDLSKLKKNKMRIRFNDLVSNLKQLGYSEQTVRGSHHIYGKEQTLPIMIVRPHSGKKYCNPLDVNKVIRLLELEKDDD